MSTISRVDAIGTAAIGVGLVAFLLFLASRVIGAVPDAPPLRDCTASCAPRRVLTGSAGACNCAPDDAWLDKMNERCGPVPYDMSMSPDGAFTYHCGRPDRVRAVMMPAPKKFDPK